jgi:transcriptional regulator with GAF, ATPase, and Fis domain
MANLDDPVRLSRFRGAVVSVSRDEVLDASVREAARRAQAPIALVTFVMGQVQYFRAATGLPPEIELTRATSRCHSYCQLVVLAGKPVVIEDIPARPELPQMVSQLYGVRAYLGLPITCDGQLLGTLCVVDVKQRQWGDELITELQPIAQRVSERLGQLAAIEPAEAKPPRAEVTPSTATMMERVLTEVVPMMRLTNGLASSTLPPDAFQRAASVLREAAEHFLSMLGSAREVSEIGKRLASAFAVTEPPPAKK